MHLVIDHQPPVPRTEQPEMREFLRAAFPVGQDLIGADRHRADILLQAGILANQVFCQRSFIDQFSHPLAHGHRVGGQDQRRCLQLCHGSHANNGFARTTGQHDHTAATARSAAGIKDIRSFLLVVPQAEGQTVCCCQPQRDG